MRLVLRDGFIQSLFVILLLTGCRSEPEKTQSSDLALPTQQATPEPIQTRQQRLQAASRLVEAGAMEQAEQVIRGLLIENPDNLPANSLMLRVLIHSQDIAGAISILDRMAQLNPARRDDMEAHAANLLYRSGDAEQAITRLESLIGRSPGFDEARRLLAQILNQQGYVFDANQQIRKLIGHTLMSRDELISLIFPTRSWVPIKEIEASSQQERRRLGIMSVAATFRIEGNPREALECLDDSELIAKNRDPAAIALYGRTLASAQLYEELATWVAAAPIQCERYPDYWIACGNLAIHKDQEAAVACFAEAIRREPHSMDAHYGLIESLETAGQMNLAQRFRRRSSVLDSINRQVKEIREAPSPRAQAFNDVTNFENEWSNHYMQTKSGSFVDSTVSFKLDTISRKMLGFGVQAIDYDNNTKWDLIVGNGHIEDLTAKGSLFAMPTQLLVGRRDGFLEQQVSGDDQYWNAMHFSRAMAKCDFNLDGRVDVVVTDLKRDAVLLENQTPTPNHWLQLELVGTSSERDAIGAHVTAEFASTSIVQTVQTGDGYLSKNESALFFGLGPSKSVQRLRVRWPSGAEQVFEDLTGEVRWLLIEGDPTPWKHSKNRLFSASATSSGPEL